MRVEDLVSPRNTAEIFEHDPDALFLKPYMTGDVFAGVPDPDAPEDDLDRTLTVTIVGHPCAIRGHGGRLKTRIPCCIVNQVTTAVPYDEWPDGNFDLFPVGDELGLGERLAVRFQEFTSVHRRELQRSRRVAALTPRGVYIFYQRFSHSLTRVAFPTGRLRGRDPAHRRGGRAGERVGRAARRGRPRREAARQARQGLPQVPGRGRRRRAA